MPAIVRAFRGQVFQSTSPARGTTPRPGAQRMWGGDFNPRPPRGGRPAGRRGWRCTSCYFNPRPPRGGRQRQDPPQAGGNKISIHVPREGDDSCAPPLINASHGFQSTSPARGTTSREQGDPEDLSISIHVPREGDDPRRESQPPGQWISIHVPREGDDSPRS